MRTEANPILDVVMSDSMKRHGRAGNEPEVFDQWLRPRGDQARELFEDGLSELRKEFRRWDYLVAREGAFRWKHELD